MTLSINNPVQQTIIFSTILVVVFLISLRWKKERELFSLSATQQLKGFAILAIIFSHIGYFLFTDHLFLFPLSIMAGVGIDLFLFLSAYGLTVSSLNKPTSTLQFYKKRFGKLFLPFWITLVALLLLDFFVLKISYSWQYIGKAFAGIFSHANLYEDINAPFWYFTFILFYYSVFPLVFSKKRLWLSAIFIYLFSYFIVWLNPTFLNNVIHLYKVHLIAFPLGMLTAWVFSKLPPHKKTSNPGRRLSILRSLTITGLITFIGYTAYHSGVGKGPSMEQLMTLVTMSAVIILFLIKKVESQLLSLFGLYSYELYLFHWPLMYRYDILYKYLPAWLATSLYLIMFLFLAWGFQRLMKARSLHNLPSKVPPSK